LVLPKAVCGSKDELISILVDRVYTIGEEPPLPSKDMLKSIHIREEIGGTLLPSGLSVPHARVKDYEGFIIAMGTPAEPIFHEGLEIRMMALIISCQTGGPHYLTSLAALTKISRDAEYFSRLCKAEQPEDFISILRERDPELA
jgi:mannitol/fructose-specific phosphotransferase system IIA component (Ntr-type)